MTMPCNCSHSRADHAFDDYDLTLELGECLVAECPCRHFCEEQPELDGKAAEYSRAVECLRTVLERFQDGTFVRNIERDGKHSEFMASALKSAAVLAEAQRVVAEHDETGARNE